MKIKEKNELNHIDLGIVPVKCKTPLNSSLLLLLLLLSRGPGPLRETNWLENSSGWTMEKN